jgi:hypothetical protein
MSRQLSFKGPNDLSELHDLILIKMPELQPYKAGVHEDGSDRRYPRMEVLGWGDIVSLTVPDGTDTKALGSIVNDYMRARE